MTAVGIRPIGESLSCEGTFTRNSGSYLCTLAKGMTQHAQARCYTSTHVPMVEACAVQIWARYTVMTTFSGLAVVGGILLVIVSFSTITIIAYEGIES